MKTKILHINVTYKITSTGSIVWDLTRVEDEKKYYVLFNFGNTQDEIAHKYENKFENVVRRGLNKYCGNRNWHCYFGTKRIIAEIEKIKPDIIHLHVIHHGILDYKMLFEFLACYNKPIVYTMHDCWAYTGGCYHYTEYGCEGYKSGCTNCVRTGYDQLDCRIKHVENNWTLKKQLFTQIDNIYFVGVSEWMCRQAEESFLNEKKIICIPNGINEVFLTDVIGTQRSTIYTIIGVASHWSEKKGLSRFFELAERLDKDKYRIILVGQKISESINIPEIITMYGPTQDVQELLQLYKQATVLVNMSYEETFGLVTAEAACAGLPVVAFDSTANTEVVNRVGGYLVRPGDIESLAETVISICENNLKNKTPMEDIHRFFSKERMVRQYMDLYDEIIKNN